MAGEGRRLPHFFCGWRKVALYAQSDDELGSKAAVKACHLVTHSE